MLLIKLRLHPVLVPMQFPVVIVPQKKALTPFGQNIPMDIPQPIGK